MKRELGEGGPSIIYRKWDIWCKKNHREEGRGKGLRRASGERNSRSIFIRTKSDECMGKSFYSFEGSIWPEKWDADGVV